MHRKRRLAALAAVATMGVTAAPAAAETIVGLTDAGKIVAFDSATPGTVSGGLTVTGLDSGDTLKAIDYRPATLQLYALATTATNTGKLYTVDIFTGAATKVTTTPFDVGNGAQQFDIDFNPTVDRLRIVGQGRQNLRLNPNTGNAPTVDGALTDGSNIVGAAYTNNHPASAVYPATPATQLFDIDAGSDSLKLQNPPNDGTLTERPSKLGVDIGDVAGFDISTSGVNNSASDYSDETAYLAGRVGTANPSLYKVDLTSGAATAVAAIGGTDKVADIAVAPPTVPVFVTLNSGTPQTLAYVRSDRPAFLTTPVAITGLKANDTLASIDTRPSTGVLYGLGRSGTVYTLDARTGVATAVNATAFALPAATDYGFDFNPTNTSVAARILGGSSNSTFNVTTGAFAAASALNYPASGDANSGKTPSVSSAAYTKDVSGTTKLFDIDDSADTTAEQGPDFNTGALKTLGPLTAGDVTSAGGLEAVDRFDQLFAALTVAGKSGLYTVNGSGTAAMPATATTAAVPATAANGSAAKIGDLGVASGITVQGLALQTAASQSTPTGSTSPYYPIPQQPVPTPTPSTKKKKAKKLTLVATPRRDRKVPIKFRAKGKLFKPNGVSKRASCKGTVRVSFKKPNGKLVKITNTKLGKNCKFQTKKVKMPTKKLLDKGKLRVVAKFKGNSRVKVIKSKVRKVKYTS